MLLNNSGTGMSLGEFLLMQSEQKIKVLLFYI